MAKRSSPRGEDKVVRIWPLPAGEKPEFVVSKELKGEHRSRQALVTGTDLLIAASADGKVRLWNIPEARPVRELDDRRRRGARAIG